jgi:hypothetical protein
MHKTPPHLPGRAGRLRAAAWLALVVGCAAPGDAIPTIRMNPGPDDHLERVTFDVVGLDPGDLAALTRVRWSVREWSVLFRVSAEDRTAAASGPARPLAGTYRVAGRALRFIPEAPLGRGLRYRAAFDASRLPGRLPGSAATIEALFSPPNGV